MVKRLDAGQAGFEQVFNELIQRKASISPEIDAAAAAIVDDVRLRGDAALLDYTRQFDDYDPAETGGFELSQEDWDGGADEVDDEVCAALESVAARIRAYHVRQLPEDVRWVDYAGVELGWQWRPIDSAGLYAPGGLARYPSSVLMSAIPAQVAGVERIVLCTPAQAGRLDPLVLLAAWLAGVHTIFRLGGAQAIAAMAYGTRTVQRVDLIAGPGNAYVAAAKRRLFGRVGIDSIAGPSEVVVVADGENDPKQVALDLLAQAEHDPQAQCIFITDHPELAIEVEQSVEEALSKLESPETARASWDANGAIILVNNLETAMALANRIAPEHLQLCSRQAPCLVEAVRHAGAVFVGSATPEVFGDYVAGPSHVLPTGGAARFSSGLSTMTFMKRTSLIRAGQASISSLGPTAERLARAEGFEAHALSMRCRLPEDSGTES